jgi:hypothetical protein
MQYARGSSSSQNIDGKRLQDILQTTSNTDEQQKVKIAFAEGYVAATGEPKPKERPSVFKAIRVVLFYGLLIMIILNILSAFGGGMYVFFLLKEILFVFILRWCSRRFC